MSFDVDPILICPQLGDDVALDDCSVVAHINSRGKFALNRLKISPGYVVALLGDP